MIIKMAIIVRKPHKWILTRLENSQRKSDLGANRKNQNKTNFSWRHQNFHIVAVILILINLISLTIANPVLDNNSNLSQLQMRKKIRPLKCSSTKKALKGVCMFAFDCKAQKGTHLGACIDGFLFGSCCALKKVPSNITNEINDNNIDQNTISHFPNEITLLPTSSLFKATTESHLYSTNTIKNKTDHLPYVPSSTTNLPSTQKYIPTKRTTFSPSKYTVQTTTVGPSKNSTHPTTVRTTKVPLKKKTTSPAPILTTLQTNYLEEDEITTQPTKIFTFQVIDTTTVPPTEATTRSSAIITTSKPVIANGSTLSTYHPSQASSNTTHRYKPTTSRRPITTKKPFATTRRTRPKPISTISSKIGSTSPTPITITTTTTTNTPIPANKEHTTAIYNRTSTKVPIPKPQPTAEIVKVTHRTQAPAIISTTATPPPSTTTTTTTSPTTTVKKVTTTTKFASTPTTSTVVPSRTTQSVPPTKLTETTTTKRPTTTKKSTTTTTTIRYDTTTQMIPSSIGIIKHTTEAPSMMTTTTSAKPSIMTWTTSENPFAMRNKTQSPILTESNVGEEDWQPRPPPADWVPVPTIDPDTGIHKNTTNAANVTTIPISPLGPNNTTEPNKIIVSISSSVSESQNASQPTSDGNTNISTATTTEQVPHTDEGLVAASSNEEISDVVQQNASLGSNTTSEYLLEDLNTTTVPSTITTAPAITSLENADYLQSGGCRGDGAQCYTRSVAIKSVTYRQLPFITNICGRRMFPEARVVGGSNATFGRWPWQISLRQWRTSTYLHKCGAALLNENWAITAAHCVDNVPPSDLLLRLGEYDLAKDEEPYGYQERRVQIVASHPQFDPRTFEYDLALLRFYEPVVFQPNIIPVCVPNNDDDFIGQTAYVTGWGRLYEDGPLPSVLQEVVVPVINNTFCEKMYRAAGYIEHIPNIFICAGRRKGGYDSCEGDSGGPMVLEREGDKRFQLAGIISWGIGCAEANQPGVYTRISQFREWVNQILQF